MLTHNKLPFTTLLLMISFASVNAVLFTPALPDISRFFAITENTAQQTITWFLVGYTLGQLVYGPIANRFGRKPALYTGIILQIISSLACVAAGAFHCYAMLVIGRFLMALGSGVGLKITFTLLNETHDALSASRKLSYLMLAFAVTPAISVLLGSMLSTRFGWESTFLACAMYGILLLMLVSQITETKLVLDKEALALKNIAIGYLQQFKNKQLVSAGLLMGAGTCIVYVFATLAPFIAISQLHMSSSLYGQANLLPSIGLIAGSITSAQLTKLIPQTLIIQGGIAINLLGCILMLAFLLLHQSVLISLFVPMMFCYAGLGLINSNVSSLAMSTANDKANSSAVLNFINMGFTTLIVLSLSTIHVQPLLLPSIFLVICLLMIGLVGGVTAFDSQRGYR